MKQQKFTWSAWCCCALFCFLRDAPSVRSLEQATRLEIAVATRDQCIMLRLLLLSLCCMVHGLTGPNTTGKICQWGCWDEEDEACHAGLNAAGLKREETFGTFFQTCVLAGNKKSLSMIVFLQSAHTFSKRRIRKPKSTRVHTPSIRGIHHLTWLQQKPDSTHEPECRTHMGERDESSKLATMKWN